MFVFLLFLIFIQSSLNVDQDVVSDVEFQIDNHLQGLSLNQQTEAHYWHLAKMAESSEWINHLIVDRINQVKNSVTSEATTCYLKAFVVDEKSGRVTAQRLENASKCDANSELVQMLIYEYPINDRDRIARRLAYYPTSEVALETLKKSLGHEYDASILFGNRETVLSDYYLFNDYNVEQSNSIHRNLMDAWRNSLDEAPELISPLDFIKVHAVITANHVLDDNFEHNFSLLQKLSGNRFYSTTTQKHVQYKRLVFTASAYGYYQTALSFYREDLLPISKSIMPLQEYLTVRMDYSTILFRIGDIVNSLEEFRELYEDFDKFSDTRYRSSLLNNLAVSYLNAGYFDQYISLQLEAYDLARELNSVTYQLQILNNLFLYYRNLGDWDNALMYLDQAETLATNSSLSTELANIRTLKAIYHRDYAKDYSLAIEILTDVTQKLESTQSFRELTVALSEISITYEIMNDFNGILSTRRRLEKLAIERDDQLVFTESLIGLGIQQFRFGKISDAKATLSRLSSINSEELEFRLKVQFYQLMALNHYHNDNLDAAISVLQEIIPELNNRIKYSGNIQTGTIFIDRSYRQVFGLLADWLLEDKRYVDTVVLLDRYKNLNKTTFLNSQMLKSSVLSEEELLIDLQLSNRIESIRRELNGADADTRLDLSNQLAQLQDEQNKLFNKILQNTSETPIDLRYISSELSKDESVIAFTSIDSVLYKATITKSAISVKRSVIGGADQELITESTKELHNGRPDLNKLYKIYGKFISESFESAKTNVIVIPDAFLYRIPIEVFPITSPQSEYSYGSVRYLIESHSISYANSIDDYIKRKRTNSAGNFLINFLGFGVSEFVFGSNSNNQRLSPLPFAVDEIQESANVLSNSGSVNVFVNQHATRDQLFSLAGNSRIVHLASHSQVNSVDPLFSRIYLQDSQSGYVDPLYAYELFNLNLSTELLVLSSCDSGSGNYSEGSGIIGLGRALNFAGAQSLIMNSWSIRDKTASDIMVSFYEFLSKGESKNESLRSAKIDYINRVNSNPAVWGSLILFGNPDAIHKKTEYQFHLIFGLIVSSLLVYFLIRRYYFIKSR